MKLLITGGTGLVGSSLVRPLEAILEIVSPKREEFDILNVTSVRQFLSREKPNIILHAAASVNAGESEKERDNKNGICWRTNVLGTQTVVEEAIRINAFVIYISTGSVFHGTEENPGPFEINAQPEKNSEKNNWYGFTKYQGELAGPHAIVRISHPIIPNKHRIKDDYVQKMLHLYEYHSLFPLFPDQLFPLTFHGDLVSALRTIIRNRQKGIFHVASPDLVSPYELFLDMLQTLGKPIDERIQKLSIETFYQQGNSPLRFAQYSALNSKKTEALLSLRFTPWHEGMAEIIKSSYTA